MSIASKFMKVARWNSLNYSHGSTYEKAVQLGSKLPESVNLRKLKKRASECQSFMFAISNQTWGRGKTLLAWSEAAVTQEAQQCWESQVQGTQTSLWIRCTTMCPACVPCCMELWLLQVSVAHSKLKWGLSWSAFDESCLRCQCISCVSLSAKAFILILLYKTLRNENNFISSN